MAIKSFFEEITKLILKKFIIKLNLNFKNLKSLKYYFFL